MYFFNSVLLVTALFVLMAIAIELGYRLGMRRREEITPPFKAHVEIIEASLLGILALLLGFTFSLSLQRYDSRSAAVVEEANTIGTAYLRAQLLPEPVRSESTRLLRAYLDVRVRSSLLPMTAQSELRALYGQATGIQAALWSVVRRVAQETPDPITALFVSSVNEMIDSFGRRDASLNRHVPQSVLLLLFGTFLMASLVIGYSSGVGGHRVSFATHVMMLLIGVLVFIIIDLDRPQRGLIRVPQSSLIELQKSLAADTRRPAPQHP